MNDFLQRHIALADDAHDRFVWFALWWIYTHGVPIVFTLLGIWIGLRVVRVVERQLVARASHNPDGERRAKTLAQILDYSAKVGFAIAFGMVLLREIGTDITPFLTGAGIVGVVVGFGAQSMVKDFLAGVFILTEDQYRVGDSVEIGRKSGIVEEINLRTTVLRGADGVAHFVPNGSITVASNQSYRWSRAMLDLKIDADEDYEKVERALVAAAKGLKDDPQWSSLLLEDPVVTGPESLEGGTITVRVQVKTLPLKQWEVSRQLRRRLLRALASAGVATPLPKSIVHYKEAPPPRAS